MNHSPLNAQMVEIGCISSRRRMTATALKCFISLDSITSERVYFFYPQKNYYEARLSSCREVLLCILFVIQNCCYRALASNIRCISSSLKGSSSRLKKCKQRETNSK